MVCHFKMSLVSAFEEFNQRKNKTKKEIREKKKLKVKLTKQELMPKQSTPLISQEQTGRFDDSSFKKFVSNLKRSQFRPETNGSINTAEESLESLRDRKRNLKRKKSKESTELQEVQGSHIIKKRKSLENGAVPRFSNSPKGLKSSSFTDNFETSSVDSKNLKKKMKSKKEHNVKLKSIDKQSRKVRRIEGEIENMEEITKESHHIPKKTIPNNTDVLPSIGDSVKDGKEMLGWILSPVDVDKFFSEYWEKQPLHISRNSNNYFDGIFSTEDLDRALKYSPMYFGKNVDVTSYIDGVRRTHNPTGRARAEVVWSLFRDGHSIRVLNPQTFIPNVGIIARKLQEFFKCMVGVNSYLTPAASQGFAPHYDDIEAFVLQLEGEKLWKVYSPRNENEVLPQYSSPNFNQEEIGEPIMEVRLRPGDLLYFPRGYIHQAKSVPDKHSFHITVSTYQKNTWADFLKKALTAALELATEENSEFRSGLPLNFLDHVGIVSSDSTDPQREKILETASKLFKNLLDFCPWDAAADQLGKQFIHDSFPPAIPNEDERIDIDKAFKKRKKKLRIKLITANCLRLVSEEDALSVYYNTDNSKEYHEEDPQSFDISPSAAPVVETLVKAYPRFCRLADLPIDDEVENGWALVDEVLCELARRCLLLYEGPFPKFKDYEEHFSSSCKN